MISNPTPRKWEAYELSSYIVASKAARQLAIFNKFPSEQKKEVVDKMNENDMPGVEPWTLYMETGFKLLLDKNPPVMVRHSKFGSEPVVKSYIEVDELAEETARIFNETGKAVELLSWWPTNFSNIVEFAKYREKEHTESFI